MYVQIFPHIKEKIKLWKITAVFPFIYTSILHHQNILTNESNLKMQLKYEDYNRRLN